MIARITKHMNEKEKGFTLIELLVVVVIIGILAAIAIPAFLKQRENAWRASVESDVKNATIAAESYSTTKNGTFDGLDLTTAKANGYNATQDVTLTIAPSSDKLTYTIEGNHAKLGTTPTYKFDSANGKAVWSDRTTPEAPAEG